MLNNNEAYICLSAIIRARETKLLSSERAERMLDAASFEEAAKMLTDCGYEDMSGMSAKEIEDALTRRKAGIFSELAISVPDPVIADLFRLKYDYHNAKVILKELALKNDSSYLLVDSGRIPGSQLKALYLEEKYPSMPGSLGRAMEEASTVLARTTNPQASDFVLDSYYLAELMQIAKNTENKFIIGYAKMLIDTSNLKAFVRTMRMGRDTEFLKTVIADGGSVGEHRIIGCAGDKEAVCALYANSNLEKCAMLGSEAIDGGSLTAFELECDNAVNTYLKQAKLMSFGPEPFVAYLAAVENEITAVRMILTGRLAGVKGETLKERLRDLYA